MSEAQPSIQPSKSMMNGLQEDHPTSPVPAVPLVYDDVELIGEMQETAFQERQWLIQRDGRFLQVSELLYRVAEQVDGERTLQQIADRLTESTEWLVTEDNVRQIIQTKLIPLGIVVPESDDDVPDPRENQIASPLRLNFRTKVIDPRLIDPITRTLQFLFAPVILILVLPVMMVAHWWLYFEHGIEQPLLQIIYSPVLLLVLLPILLLSAVFHEFGHASGLRYGGGRARSIGVGLYLIYPAFYTDTSDNYRLGRWAKVRTDLGGIYFHLIFAVAVMGLYLLTGQEFLLLTVFVINLEAVRQLIPFVRFDGYWILADLTGIPDLFTHIKSVATDTAASRRGIATRTASNLKPWVKKILFAYVLVTIPLLGILTFFFIKRIPLVLENVQNSLFIQADQLQLAWSQGNVSGMALAIVQQLILLLQLLAIAYLFYILGKWAVRFVMWGWRSQAPVARVGSAIGTIALVLLLAYIWIP